jgi:GTP pyrophosphokinase
VFTPQGELKSLPKGATPLDFAFSVHTEVGMRTRGARVNGKLVPLSQELKSGDQVEIITSDQARPTNNWLDYATTARARSKIKSSLKEDKKAIAEDGKATLLRKLKSQKIQLNEKSINELVSYFKLNTSLDLFYRVGVGTIDNRMIKEFAAQRSNGFMSFIKNKIRKPTSPENISKEEITNKYDSLVFGMDEQKLDFSMSPCCSPIPGDPVFGFTTINEGIKVHKNNCPNAIDLRSKYAYRIIQAKWIDSSAQGHSAEIQLTGIDNLGLVNSVTKEISDHMHVNIKGISFTTNGGVFKGNITVVVQTKTHLDKLMNNLKKINGIDQVTRV